MLAESRRQITTFAQFVITKKSLLLYHLKFLKPTKVSVSMV
jgi:hypothetical protein